MKTWLITGCSSGLGKSLASAVLEHGNQVIVTARNPETVQFFQENFPKTAFILQLDITKEDDVKRVVAEGIKHFGSIDVLSIMRAIVCAALWKNVPWRKFENSLKQISLALCK